MLVEADDVIVNEVPQTGACASDFEAGFSSECQEPGQSAIQAGHRVMGTEHRARSGDNSSLETALSCWEAGISFQIPFGGSWVIWSEPQMPHHTGDGG